LNKWKKKILLKLIQERVNYFISKYKFNFNPTINQISIKKMISKWGSCSIQHNLNFNLNLIEKRIEIIDYVVVHELTHTINFNHSKDFWNNVNKIIPNYLELKNELKK
jgi:predicted metal-dependent hydrolase